jgi:hypothetical protein
MTPKPMDHFADLTPAEHERLAILAEECAEVIQVIGKIMRHGYESYHPDDEDCKNSNRRLLEKELGHVDAELRVMLKAGDLEIYNIKASAKKKAETIKPYLHHQ